MRVTKNWLAESVEIAPDTTAEQIHAALVQVGLEEEEIHRFEVSGPVVVGRVLERNPEPQTNGKTINWCQVRVAPEGERAADGGEDVRGIVCGAHNFEVGDLVVVTLPGAVLPGDFRIAARKTYGHVSDGMMASPKELGLGEDHDGILVLNKVGIEAEPGDDALEILGLDDVGVEVNVTPDRGYAFSVRGVAREYAHSTGAAFSDPAKRPAPLPAITSEIAASIEEPAAGAAPLATSVAFRVLRGVDANAPTPRWMVARLTLAGIRSISLIVDVTNYVMLELGQPLHAYDLDRVTGAIAVRAGRAGEILETLDHKKRDLSPADIVIADESGAIGLGGVMGGAATEVTDDTHNVLLEAAAFDSVRIARAVRRHKLPSEASKRFERGIDAAVSEAALARAAELIVAAGGGGVTGEGVVLGTVPEPQPVRMRRSEPARLVGVDYTDDEIRGALETIGCTVERDGDDFIVTPPTWRRDLTFPAALVEEVARIVGYDRIPSELPIAPPGRGLTRAQVLRRQVANTLAARGGVEVLSYPFFSKEVIDRFGHAENETTPAMKLANAMDASQPYLRTNLLPGLLQVAKRNLSRGRTDLSVFEIGTVFQPGASEVPGTETIPGIGAKPADDVIRSLQQGVPSQPRHLGVLLVGDRVRQAPGIQAEPFDWRDALDQVAAAARAVGAEISVRQGSHRAMHPGRTAEIFVTNGSEEISLGFAGELLPAIATDADLPARVAVGWVDLDALIAAAPERVESLPIAPYPLATQDLSLVVDTEIPAGNVLAAIRDGAGELLESIRLTKDYRGEGIDEGKRSLTFALGFRAPDRTLTAAEATEAKEAGAARAAELFGATPRV